MPNSPNNGRLAVEQRLTRIETRLDAMADTMETTASHNVEAHHDTADRLGRIEKCINTLNLKEAERRGEMTAYKRVAGIISGTVAALVAGLVVWIERFFK